MSLIVPTPLLPVAGWPGDAYGVVAVALEAAPAADAPSFVALAPEGCDWPAAQAVTVAALTPWGQLVEIAATLAPDGTVTPAGMSAALALLLVGETAAMSIRARILRRGVSVPARLSGAIRGVTAPVIAFDAAAAAGQVARDGAGLVASGAIWTAADGAGGAGYTVGAGVRIAGSGAEARFCADQAAGRIFAAGASAEALFARLDMEAGGARLRIGAAVDDLIDLSPLGPLYAFVRAAWGVAVDGSALWLRIDAASGASVTRGYDLSGVAVPDASYSTFGGGALSRLSGLAYSARGLVMAATLRVRAEDGGLEIVGGWSLRKADVTGLASLAPFIAALPAASDRPQAGAGLSALLGAPVEGAALAFDVSAAATSALALAWAGVTLPPGVTISPAGVGGGFAPLAAPWPVALRATDARGVAIEVSGTLTPTDATGVEWDVAAGATLTGSSAVIAVGATPAAALARLDAGGTLSGGTVIDASPPVAPVSTPAGVVSVVGGAWSLAAVAGLAVGEARGGAFGFVRRRAAQSLIGLQRAVAHGALTPTGQAQTATTFTKAAGATQAVTWFFDGQSGFSERLATDQTVTLACTANLSGGTSRALTFRVQNAATVFSTQTINAPAGVATPLTFSVAIPAGVPTAGLRLVLVFGDAASSGSVGAMVLTGSLIEVSDRQDVLAVEAATPGFAVADAVEGAKLWLWLDPAWPGWAAGRAVLWSVDGVPASSPVAVAGLHLISAGLTVGQPAAVSVSGDGGANWSAAATATPTAASTLRSAVFADAFAASALAEDVLQAGEAVASAAGANVTLSLSGGEQLELVGPGAVFEQAYAHVANDMVRPFGSALGVGEVELPRQRARIVDPGAGHLGRAPLEAASLSYKLRRPGDAADQTATLVVLGAAGAWTQPAVSAVGFDADGDPVAFRFDRKLPVGRMPDGRPFVVAPAGVALIANGGGPNPARPGRQTVPAGRVAAWRGAELLVVATAGQVPHDEVALTLTTAVARHAGAWDWSGWGAPVDQGAGLTVDAQFESLHLYLDSADPAVCALRYRKQGTAEWLPGHDFVFDGRALGQVDHTGPVGAGGMAEATWVRGAHRIQIPHLESGVAYELQARQGAKLWTAVASTESYKVPKAPAETPAAVGGVVTLTQGGSAAQWREYAPPPMNGALVIDADYVIVKNPRVFGAPQHAIRVAEGRHHVRIVGGAVRGWGRDLRSTGASRPGWAMNHDCAIAYNLSGHDSHHVAAIGTMIGPPRRPANSWQEYNPEVGSVNPVVGYGVHPWGSSAIYAARFSVVGCNAWLDLSVSGHALRTLHDGLREGQQVGTSEVLAHCATDWFVDDADENESPNGACGLILNVHADARVCRPYLTRAAAGLAHSQPRRGPAMVLRPVIVPRWDGVPTARRSNRGAGFPAPIVQGYGDPIKAIARSDPAAMILLYHATSWHEEAAAGSEIRFQRWLSTASYVRGRNNLLLSTYPPATAGPGVDWDPSNLAFQSRAAFDAEIAFEPGASVPTAAVAGAVPLPGVNDTGPWAMTGTPSVGAAEPA